MSGRIQEKKGRVKEGEVMKGSARQFNSPSGKIKAEFMEDDSGKIEEEAVAPATTLRERILALSLFPNIYNKKFMLGHY